MKCYPVSPICTEKMYLLILQLNIQKWLLLMKPSALFTQWAQWLSARGFMFENLYKKDRKACWKWLLNVVKATVLNISTCCTLNTISVMNCQIAQIKLFLLYARQTLATLAWLASSQSVLRQNKLYITQKVFVPSQIIEVTTHLVFRVEVTHADSCCHSDWWSELYLQTHVALGPCFFGDYCHTW